MILALLLFAALAADGPHGVPVRDACGEDASTVAIAESTDQITIHYGVAGEAVPCYAVSLMRAGTEIRGYVLGSTSPAVQEFERHRAAESRIPAQAPPAPPPAPVTADGKKPVDRTIEDPGPLAGRQFPSWTGVDLRGRSVAIPGNAKLTLVLFWRPQSHAARAQAVELQNIERKFDTRGLKSVGLIVGADAASTNGYIEDLSLHIPLAVDHSALAAAFGADATKGTTLVLDSSGKVIASSSDPKKIQAIVSKLLSLK